MRSIKIMHVGLGPLGIRMCRMSAARAGEQIVSAVDIDPVLIGKSLGRICDIDDDGVRIVGTVAEAIGASGPDVALLTTVSDMPRITPQILEILANGIPVVSTCEELSHPWDTHPDLAREIDRVAKEAGVAVLGTGVNPGFLMDTLPAQLTAVCSRVDFVEVHRFQDARFRRLPFQLKIGAGLNETEFERKHQEGTLRHVGLTESMHFIASQLGWKLDRTEDILTPVIAGQQLDTEHLSIQAGEATGVRQVGHGFVDGELRIRLIFQASVGEPESFDEIVIKGEPDIVSRIDGGVNGDVATCAIALNSVRTILRARPGLRTMADMPMVAGVGV